MAFMSFTATGVIGIKAVIYVSILKREWSFIPPLDFRIFAHQKNTQAEIYSRGIKCTDLSFCRKIVISLFIPGNTDQIRNELFEYLAVTAMIGFCQLAPGYALPSPK
jgi:hypothetical protein